MAIEQRAMPGTCEYLEEISRRHWAEVEELRKLYPDPDAALDDYIRAHFTPDVIEQVLREVEEGDDEGDGW